MKFGTPEQKAKYLPRIVAGDIVFCQGYSEPGSGSDLASLKTRAVRDGDDYVINGTKIWTTGAHVADHMFCLVRTATEGKPQDGISFVLIDSMKTAGPHAWSRSCTLAGDHEVNQVFFDNVRTPVANRIGPENAGWTVAKYLLEFERGGEAYTPNLYARIEDVQAYRQGGGRGRYRPADRGTQLRRAPGRDRDGDPGAGDDRDAGPFRPQQGPQSRGGLLGDEDPRQRDLAEARLSRRRGAGLVCGALRTRRRACSVTMSRR